MAAFKAGAGQVLIGTPGRLADLMRRCTSLETRRLEVTAPRARIVATLPALVHGGTGGGTPLGQSLADRDSSTPAPAAVQDRMNAARGPWQCIERVSALLGGIRDCRLLPNIVQQILHLTSRQCRQRFPRGTEHCANVQSGIIQDDELASCFQQASSKR